MLGNVPALIIFTISANNSINKYSHILLRMCKRYPIQAKFFLLESQQLYFVQLFQFKTGFYISLLSLDNWLEIVKVEK